MVSHAFRAADYLQASWVALSGAERCSLAAMPNMAHEKGRQKVGEMGEGDLGSLRRGAPGPAWAAHMGTIVVASTARRVTTPRCAGPLPRRGCAVGPAGRPCLPASARALAEAGLGGVGAPAVVTEDGEDLKRVVERHARAIVDQGVLRGR